MAKNGRDSCTKHFRHINIHHLFVKDKSYKGEIEVNYHRNHFIIAEYFTKLMQGKMFRIFRDFIVVYVHINYPLQEIEFSAKERVDKSKNMTENSIPINVKISYAEVCKASKRGM